MRVFRNNSPQRTYSGSQKANYGDYRDDLRKDFNGRCGYTDCLDIWWGDGFHIDHFAPRKPKVTDPIKLAKFKAREHIYSNLVYACPQVNRAKGNDWASDDPDVPIVADKGYLDPCGVDFNDYFERTDSGRILPKDNPVARYMWAKLKLYLKRYELYWRLDQIIDRLQKLTEIHSKLRMTPDIERDVLIGIADLTKEYIKYLKYLQVNYPRIIR